MKINIVIKHFEILEILCYSSNSSGILSGTIKLIIYLCSIEAQIIANFSEDQTSILIVLDLLKNKISPSSIHFIIPSIRIRHLHFPLLIRS